MMPTNSKLVDIEVTGCRVRRFIVILTITAGILFFLVFVSAFYSSGYYAGSGSFLVAGLSALFSYGLLMWGATVCLLLGVLKEGRAWFYAVIILVCFSVPAVLNGLIYLREG